MIVINCLIWNMPNHCSVTANTFCRPPLLNMFEIKRLPPGQQEVKKVFLFIINPLSQGKQTSVKTRLVALSWFLYVLPCTLPPNSYNRGSQFSPKVLLTNILATSNLRSRLDKYLLHHYLNISAQCLGWRRKLVMCCTAAAGRGWVRPACPPNTLSSLYIVFLNKNGWKMKVKEFLNVGTVGCCRDR